MKNFFKRDLTWKILSYLYIILIIMFIISILGFFGIL